MFSENVECKGLWSKQNNPLLIVPMPNLDQEEAMLCILPDWKGFPYYELIMERRMIDSNMYCSH